MKRHEEIKFHKKISILFIYEFCLKESYQRVHYQCKQNINFLTLYFLLRLQISFKEKKEGGKAKERKKDQNHTPRKPKALEFCSPNWDPCIYFLKQSFISPSPQQGLLSNFLLHLFLNSYHSFKSIEIPLALSFYLDIGVNWAFCYEVIISVFNYLLINISLVPVALLMARWSNFNSKLSVHLKYYIY